MADDARGHICWYCHWGWAKPVADVYVETLAKLDGNEDALHFGPAHIVWEDENWEDGSIDFCLKECGKPFYELGSVETAIVRESLEKLREIPESVRCCCPGDYDGHDPEQYPPTVEVVKVTKHPA